MKYGVTLTTKVSPELIELIDKVSSYRGEGRSSWVRRAILTELARIGFLGPEQRKSLGFAGQEL